MLVIKTKQSAAHRSLAVAQLYRSGVSLANLEDIWTIFLVRLLITNEWCIIEENWHDTRNRS